MIVALPGLFSYFFFNQTDIIEAFNSTSRYLDDLLNIDNIYFDQTVDRIYPTELPIKESKFRSLIKVLNS